MAQVKEFLKETKLLHKDTIEIKASTFTQNYWIELNKSLYLRFSYRSSISSKRENWDVTLAPMIQPGEKNEVSPILLSSIEPDALR